MARTAFARIWDYIKVEVPSSLAQHGSLAAAIIIYVTTCKALTLTFVLFQTLLSFPFAHEESWGP